MQFSLAIPLVALATLGTASARTAPAAPSGNRIESPAPALAPDGITEMTGTATFTTTGVSLNLTIPEGQGVFDYHLGGGVGESVPVIDTPGSVDPSGLTVSASSLPSGIKGKAYTVGVSYVLDGELQVLTGTIASAPGPGKSATVTLQ